MFLTYRLSGLGALPAMPSNKRTFEGGLLKPDHVWIRYYEGDYNHQLRQCPKNPPYGCTLIDGYAWGQAPWYEDEFAPANYVPPKQPLPYPKPTVSTTTTQPALPSVITSPQLYASPRITVVARRPREVFGVGDAVGVGLFVAIGLTLLL